MTDVEPFDEIYRFPRHADVADFVEKKIAIALDNGYLVSQCSVGVAMSHESSELTVTLGVGSNDAQLSGRGDIVEGGVLHKFTFASTISVDVIPCCRIVKGQLIRPNADYVAIFFVHLTNLERDFS